MWSWGCCWRGRERLSEARTELAAATQLDPGEAGPGAKARAWRALAEIDSATDPAKASEDLLEALKLSPETPTDTLLAASLAEQTGQLDAAEQAYRRMLAKDPKSAAANAGLAHLLIARKQYPEAETLLRAALEQSPEDTALTAQLATVLAAEDKAEALPLFQKLHDAHPKDAAITRMLAAVMDDAGDVAGSDKLYVTLLDGQPQRPGPAGGARAKPDSAAQVRRGLRGLRQGHPAGCGQRRRLERPGLCRIEDQSARDHDSRADHAVEVSSGNSVHLLSLGNQLRCAPPKGAGSDLLPSLSGLRRPENFRIRSGRRGKGCWCWRKNSETVDSEQNQ